MKRLELAVLAIVGKCKSYEGADARVIVVKVRIGGNQNLVRRFWRWKTVSKLGNFEVGVVFMR